MNASDRTLSRRYAQALFLSAAEGGQQEKVRAELTEAYKTLSGQMAHLKNPTIGPKDHKALIQKSAPNLSSKTRSFLELLIDKKRINLLPVIVGDLIRIADEAAGRVRAQVRSASELSAEELETLLKRLRKYSGKDVVAETKVDPELLGGVVVRMGDLVLDGSIQGKLRNLAAALTEEQ
ncbi:MAG: ATP synthase F1 subunit delta [Elusimicrobia bacterium]|nr:ATP synthase F1 subunit delta [Elusimicrobiota bacterium]